MKRQWGAAAAAIVILLAIPLSVSAAYPPGTFPGAAPGGAYRTIVMSQLVCANGGSMQASYDRSALILQVPKDAFSACTQVSIYVAEPGVIAPLLPAGANLIDGFAVGWLPVGIAARTLTLSINDVAITPAAQVFETAAAGVRPFAGAKVQAGAATLDFTSPTGFVLSAAEDVSASPTGGVLGATGYPQVSPSPAIAVPTVSSPTTNYTQLVVVLLVLLVIGVIVLAVVARRRSSGSSR